MDVELARQVARLIAGIVITDDDLAIIRKKGYEMVRQLADDVKDGKVEEFDVGCGAYKLDGFEPGQFSKYTRNPNYFLSDRAFVDSAYFEEAGWTLREAEGYDGAPHTEINQLLHYVEDMQAFLDADYRSSVSALEAWVDAGGAEGERELARRAAAAIGRVARLVGTEAEDARVVDAAKQLQLRLDAEAV